MISTTALAAGSALVGGKGEGKMVKHVILWKLKDDITVTDKITEEDYGVSLYTHAFWVCGFSILLKGTLNKLFGNNW